MSQSNRVARYISFSDSYKESCFITWYQAGCPASMDTIMNVIPADDAGVKPSKSTLFMWKQDFGWSQRADVLNARAAQELETELVEQRKAMLRKHAAEGAKLQELGMDYLKGKDNFENDSTALHAVLEGAVLERTSLGLSEALTRIMRMTDEQLVVEVQNILKNANRTQPVIEMGEVGEEPEVEEENAEELENDGESE